MSAPNWQAVLPGQAMQVGQLNQFFTPHACDYGYVGSVITSNTLVLGTAEDFTTSFAMSYKFSSSVNVDMTRVALAISKVSAGIDLIVQLQSDSGSGPSGTVLASTYLPAEWINTNNIATVVGNGTTITVTLVAPISLPSSSFSFEILGSSNGAVNTTFTATAGQGGYVTSFTAPSSFSGTSTGGEVFISVVTPAHGVPLAYSLVASTFYHIVVFAANSSAAEACTAKWQISTEASNGYVYNGTTWVVQSFGFGIAIYGGTSGTIATTYEDSGAKMIGIGRGETPSSSANQASTIRTWTKYSSSANANLLCRDDANFTYSIGTFVAQSNCTVSRSNGTSEPPIGAYSLKLVCNVASAPSMSAATTLNASSAPGAILYIPVTAGQVYSAIASFATNGSSFRSAFVSVSWYSLSGALVSTVNGSTVTEVVADAFVTSVLSGAVAPAGAGVAVIEVTVNGTLASGEEHFVDNIGFFQGANTTWSYPGAGIASVRNLTYVSSQLYSMA